MSDAKKSRVADALKSMTVGACGVKWDVVVWRIAEDGWIVGTEGVRKDGFIHDFASVMDWFDWKLTAVAA